MPSVARPTRVLFVNSDGPPGADCAISPVPSVPQTDAGSICTARPLRIHSGGVNFPSRTKRRSRFGRPARTGFHSAGHSQLLQSVENLGHPCPADTQEPSQFGPRADLAGIKQRLIVQGKFHPIRLRFIRRLFRLRDAGYRFPAVKFDFRRST